MGIKIKARLSDMVKIKVNKMDAHCMVVGTRRSERVHTMLHGMHGNKKKGMPSHLVEAKINKMDAHCMMVRTRINKQVHTIVQLDYYTIGLFSSLSIIAILRSSKLIGSSIWRTSLSTLLRRVLTNQLCLILLSNVVM